MIRDLPLAVFVVSLVLLTAATRLGVFLRMRKRSREGVADGDHGYDLLAGATLTLMGLVIGFTFSMAVSRYDQRKNLEAAEANAIGTEYLRLDLLKAADSAPVRDLLKHYLDARIVWYSPPSHAGMQQNAERTAALQGQLWTAVVVATAEPSPNKALVVSGMNGVLDARGFAEAAALNRIPSSAWGLMAAIGLCGAMLIGFAAQDARTAPQIMLVLPLVVSISFLLIADVDTPTGGVIRVAPQSLLELQQALKST